MEKANTQHPELHIPFMERIKSIPEIFGIRVNEEPEYRTLFKEGSFEIREYQPQVHALTTVTGHTFDHFRETAFKKLAAYIFGGSTQQENVAMTAPVLLQKGALSPENTVPMNAPILQTAGGEKTWTMSFILPSKFNEFTAPTPLDPDVRIGVRPAHVLGVASYSGNNSMERIKEHEKELAHWLGRQKGFRAVGQPIIAQYDAPFTLPFVKRNEIHIELLRVH